MDRKYYVYIRPGHIEYFDDLSSAIECAEYYSSEVREC